MWPFKKKPKPQHVVTLRDIQDADGTRHLWATMSSDGGLEITGRDYGEGVRRHFGESEYEWVWTIPAAAIPALRAALGTESDVLAALGEQFSGDKASGLSVFLEDNGIEMKAWSRIGD